MRHSSTLDHCNKIWKYNCAPKSATGLNPPVFAQQNYGQSYRLVLQYEFKKNDPVLEERFTSFKVGKLTCRIVALIRV